jgi:hypothetical protein
MVPAPPTFIHPACPSYGLLPAASMALISFYVRCCMLFVSVLVACLFCGRVGWRVVGEGHHDNHAWCLAHPPSPILPAWLACGILPAFVGTPFMYLQCCMRYVPLSRIHCISLGLGGLAEGWWGIGIKLTTHVACPTHLHPTCLPGPQPVGPP